MYEMTQEDNILFAKRNIVDSIYKEARLEGISATFPETNEILEGRSVAGLSVDDILVINNLKHAWQFVFDTIDVPIDLPYIRQLHGIIGTGIVMDAGQLRAYDVSIGGTTWRPDIPDYDQAKEVISTICSADFGKEKAIVLFANLCRMQLFADGNKRTAQLVANKMLIETGSGILAVPVEKKLEFSEKLISYYETNNLAPFVDFINETSIDGYGPKSQAKLSPARDAAARAAKTAQDRAAAAPQQSKPAR